MLFIDMNEESFNAKLDAILSRREETSSGIEKVVEEIISAVRERGDEAVLEFTRRFDRLDVRSVGELEMSKAEIDACCSRISADDMALLQLACERIVSFHEKQKQQTWISMEEPDILLGQKVTPLERVGIYVPGGKASYPSSVVMNAAPARVAGVKEIIMVTPAPGGEVNPHVVAAARLAGVSRIFRTGGAQAVAALAFGTESIPKVDKITGPGNIYVATAKKLVFGYAGIDMIAGPSEILVISDGSGDPAHIAADLLSQAEHDELASSILITTEREIRRKSSR